MAFTAGSPSPDAPGEHRAPEQEPPDPAARASGGRRRRPERPRWLDRLRLGFAQFPVSVAHLLRVGAVLLTLLAGQARIVTSVEHAVIFGLVALYVAVTTLRERTLLLDLADLAVALTLAGVLGGVTNVYLPVIMALIGAIGSSGSVVRGAAAGLGVSLAIMAFVVFSGNLSMSRVIELSPALSLLPLTGITGGLARRVLGPEQDEGREALELTNLLLTDLRRLVKSVPGGLDVSTVSWAALAELRARSDAQFGAVMVNNQGLLMPVASFGLQDVPLAPVRLEDVATVLESVDPRILSAAQLSEALSEMLGKTPYCGLASLRKPESREITGVIGVGYGDLESVGTLRRHLSEVAGDTSLALDNARLLADTHQESVASARRQIAHDLHDGLAQSLTHLRMELELLGLGASDPELEEELERLGRVVERSLGEVRGTIAGLRAPLTPRGLVQALRRHVDDLDGLGGIAVRLEASGSPELSEESRGQVLRVAQEALSNALRHSGADEIVVHLAQQDDHLVLRVEDDGRGIKPDDQPAPEGGVGMTTMRHRADRLNGRLELRSRPGGGTVVELVIPTGDNAPAPPRR